MSTACLNCCQETLPEDRDAVKNAATPHFNSTKKHGSQIYCVALFLRDLS